MSMKILVTGAKGFVGRNLCENLKNIRDGKNRTTGLEIEEVFEYDLDSTALDLEYYCNNSDFVFNLAGVNRPKTQEEFMQGNFGFASQLLGALKRHGNKCPVMLSSSIQATLIGRYDGEYGRSKKAGEDLFFDCAKETGAKVLVYRFRTCSVNGADRIITLRLQRSAMPLLMTCLTLSMTPVLNLSYFTLMTSLTR